LIFDFDFDTDTGPDPGGLPTWNVEPGTWKVECHVLPLAWARAGMLQSWRGTTMANRADKSAQKWPGRATATSDALDLEEGVFTWSDPKRIAASLKRSADKSMRRKSPPFRSAMSMLAF
jgi:hypothetical protein